MRRKRKRDILVQGRDAGEFHSFRGLQCIARDLGANINLSHLDGDPKTLKCPLDDICVRPQISGGWLLYGGPEERERRWHIVLTHYGSNSRNNGLGFLSFFRGRFFFRSLNVFRPGRNRSLLRFVRFAGYVHRLFFLFFFSSRQTELQRRVEGEYQPDRCGKNTDHYRGNGAEGFFERPESESEPAAVPRGGKFNESQDRKQKKQCAQKRNAENGLAFRKQENAGNEKQAYGKDQVSPPKERLERIKYNGAHGPRSFEAGENKYRRKADKRDRPDAPFYLGTDAVLRLLLPAFLAHVVYILL